MSPLEHFTHRARHVLTLAEAAARQFNQPAVGTEHLLLGLMREEYGLASQVLHNLGVEHHQIMDLIPEFVPKPEAPSPSGLERSAEVDQTMELAVEEAHLLDQRYIGTEHLLLGLIRQDDSTALRLLKRLDVDAEQIRQEIKRLSEEQSSANANILAALTESESASESPQMTMAIVNRVLEMVSENRLSSVQASELLRALPLDLTLTASGKASFASMVNNNGQQLKRHVRVTVCDSASKQTLFEIVNPLDSMLAFVDHFLRLVGDNDFESLVLDGDRSPIVTELRIEKDEQDK